MESGRDSTVLNSTQGDRVGGVSTTAASHRSGCEVSVSEPHDEIRRRPSQVSFSGGSEYAGAQGGSQGVGGGQPQARSKRGLWREALATMRASREALVESFLPLGKPSGTQYPEWSTSYDHEKAPPPPAAADLAHILVAARPHAMRNRAVASLALALSTLSCEFTSFLTRAGADGPSGGSDSPSAVPTIKMPTALVADFESYNKKQELVASKDASSHPPASPLLVSSPKMKLAPVTIEDVCMAGQVPLDTLSQPMLTIFEAQDVIQRCIAGTPALNGCYEVRSALASVLLVDTEDDWGPSFEVAPRRLAYKASELEEALSDVMRRRGVALAFFDKKALIEGMKQDDIFEDDDEEGGSPARGGGGGEEPQMLFAEDPQGASGVFNGSFTGVGAGRTPVAMQALRTRRTDIREADCALVLGPTRQAESVALAITSYNPETDDLELHLTEVSATALLDAMAMRNATTGRPQGFLAILPTNLDPSRDQSNSVGAGSISPGQAPIGQNVVANAANSSNNNNNNNITFGPGIIGTPQMPLSSGSSPQKEQEQQQQQIQNTSHNIASSLHSVDLEQDKGPSSPTISALEIVATATVTSDNVFPCFQVLAGSMEAASNAGSLSPSMPASQGSTPAGSQHWSGVFPIPTTNVNRRSSDAALALDARRIQLSHIENSFATHLTACATGVAAVTGSLSRGLAINDIANSVNMSDDHMGTDSDATLSVHEVFAYLLQYAMKNPQKQLDVEWCPVVQLIHRANAAASVSIEQLRDTLLQVRAANLLTGPDGGRLGSPAVASAENNDNSTGAGAAPPPTVSRLGATAGPSSSSGLSMSTNEALSASTYNTIVRTIDVPTTACVLVKVRIDIAIGTHGNGFAGTGGATRWLVVAGFDEEGSSAVLLDPSPKRFGLFWNVTIEQLHRALTGHGYIVLSDKRGLKTAADYLVYRSETQQIALQAGTSYDSADNLPEHGLLPPRPIARCPLSLAPCALSRIAGRNITFSQFLRSLPHPVPYGFTEEISIAHFAHVTRQYCHETKLPVKITLVHLSLDASGARAVDEAEFRERLKAASDNVERAIVVNFSVSSFTNTCRIDRGHGSFALLLGFVPADGRFNRYDRVLLQDCADEAAHQVFSVEVAELYRACCEVCGASRRTMGFVELRSFLGGGGGNSGNFEYIGGGGAAASPLTPPARAFSYTGSNVSVVCEGALSTHQSWDVVAVPYHPEIARHLFHSPNIPMLTASALALTSLGWVCNESAIVASSFQRNAATTPYQCLPTVLQSKPPCLEITQPMVQHFIDTVINAHAADAAERLKQQQGDGATASLSSSSSSSKNKNNQTSMAQPIAIAPSSVSFYAALNAMAKYPDDVRVILQYDCRHVHATIRKFVSAGLVSAVSGSGSQATVRVLEAEIAAFMDTWEHPASKLVELFDRKPTSSSNSSSSSNCQDKKTMSGFLVMYRKNAIPEDAFDEKYVVSSATTTTTSSSGNKKPVGGDDDDDSPFNKRATSVSEQPRKVVVAPLAPSPPSAAKGKMLPYSLSPNHRR